MGEPAAAEPLYEHFCSRLKQLARNRIPTNIRQAYDQDDVAISAFHSVFLGVRQQRYQLRDRFDFWRLLITIAERKIAKRIRHELREKRDVRRLVRDSVRVQDDQSNRADGVINSLAANEPTPALAVEVAETCEVLLALLPDDTSRRIAVMKLENHTASEIAAELGCTRKTVQRKLFVIRKLWQHVGGVETEEPEPGKMSQAD